MLRLHVNKDTPIFGPLLRTTCSMDEVCLTDSIPEAGEQYPNKQLDVTIESVRPPKIRLDKGKQTAKQ